MPVGSIKPNFQLINMQRKSAIDKITRSAKALDMLLAGILPPLPPLPPLSMKYMAKPRLAMMAMKAKVTIKIMGRLYL
jgi:hypothetical protein